MPVMIALFLPVQPKEGPQMPESLPALSLVAVPGRRRLTIEVAREAERRGYSGLYMPSIFGNMAQCTALGLVTERIVFGTAIAPIYARTVEDFAHSARYIHEISGGRFRFGIGVAHAPSHIRMGVTPGKPLGDIRAFVAKFRSYEGIGAAPPIILAALRRRMVALAGEIADGLVFANASRSHMAEALSVIPAGKRADPAFLIANMIPTCICDDVEAAKGVNRRTLTRYVMLPNYRNYWKEAGYVEEMVAIESAIAHGRQGDLPALMSDRWLADATLFGAAAAVRDGVALWREAGITTPILVPSSAAGNQLKAVEEIFAAFA
jgi:alkanesulfonate monooxygenase SsuD/methylene tetrahydromethanopterin reductase-like flavin-dependent oxidoreductase (luciferase family)